VLARKGEGSKTTPPEGVGHGPHAHDEERGKSSQINKGLLSVRSAEKGEKERNGTPGHASGGAGRGDLNIRGHYLAKDPGIPWREIHQECTRRLQPPQK